MVGIFLIDGRETSTSITRIAGVKMAVKLFRRNVRTKNRSNLYLSARLKRFSTHVLPTDRFLDFLGTKGNFVYRLSPVVNIRYLIRQRDGWAVIREQEYTTAKKDDGNRTCRVSSPLNGRHKLRFFMHHDVSLPFDVLDIRWIVKVISKKPLARWGSKTKSDSLSSFFRSSISYNFMK